MSYKNITLTPAYGRDYRSAAAVMIDWKAEKDFVLQPAGSYCSILNTAYRDWDWIDTVTPIRLLPEPHRRIRWLTREEARACLEGPHPSIKSPPKIAIARTLLQAWVDGFEV